MSDDGLKIELALSDDTLPGLFRDLADALEKDGTGDFSGNDLTGFERFKLTLKRRADRIDAKVKVEFAGSGDPSDPDRPLKYKSLKKRMKADFKQIVAALGTGAMPLPEVVARFLADSETMCSFPGKGDEHYPEYLGACARFREACESGDVKSALVATAALVACKNTCHAVYK